MLLHALTASTSSARAEDLAALLRARGTHAVPLGPDGNLWESLRSEAVDVLAIDVEAIDVAPSAFIANVRALPDAPKVIVFVDDSRPELRAALQAAQASAVIDRNAPDTVVAEALTGVLSRLLEQAHQKFLAGQADIESNLGDFSTASRSMREFLALVRKVVNSDSTLLVLGETGVGKEYLSRAIHTESPRSSGPFVPVNCSALSETLLESELFGHVEGAFTGATRGRKGYFEMAHGGTLFLDEVGELRPQTQVKLLRVLQERRVQPVGAEREIEIDVRLIAATNRGLDEEVDAGRFRADLFYRLSVVKLEVPPLRERKEDIRAMFESHVEHFRIAMKRHAETVREDAMRLLVEHPWPGNVRELINVAERAVLLCEGAVITPTDLPEEIRGGGRPLLILGKSEQEASADSDTTLATMPFKQARRRVLDAFERSYIESLLASCNGRINDAAQKADMHTRSLYEKMRRLEIRKEAFKLR